MEQEDSRLALEGCVMSRRIGAVLAVGLAVVTGLFALAKQQTALGQARQAEAVGRCMA